MNYEFKELDYQKTPIGEISLRRRAEPRLDGKIIYEVKLGDEFLMSSLFVEAEIQLSRLGLAALAGHGLDIVVGGLGLGYTAAAVLENPSVKSLLVIEVMKPVIDWHKNNLVPLGNQLYSDPRCTLLHADFFELASSAFDSFDSNTPGKLVHGVLLDIDHSPNHWLTPANRSFYSEDGFHNVSSKLTPGGVFGLWSNDPPDSDFVALLEQVFFSAQSHVIQFPNPYTGGKSSNTVYIARKK